MVFLKAFLKLKKINHDRSITIDHRTIEIGLSFVRSHQCQSSLIDVSKTYLHH
jgi:hypothetical protein